MVRVKSFPEGKLRKKVAGAVKNYAKSCRDKLKPVFFKLIPEITFGNSE